MRAIACGGGVPGDRVRRGSVFRAEVVAVELELDPRDSESADAGYAGGDRHRAADGGSGSRGGDGDDQAARPQLRLGRLRRDQAPADHRQQDRYTSNSIVHGFSRLKVVSACVERVTCAWAIWLSSPLQCCYGVLPCAAAVQRAVLAEHAVPVECAVLADDAVLAPGAGPRTTGRPSFRPESSAHSSRAVARSTRCSRAKAAGPWCHPAARRAATL